jgi:hypothetical protein
VTRPSRLIVATIARRRLIHATALEATGGGVTGSAGWSAAIVTPPLFEGYISGASLHTAERPGF